MRQIDTIVLVRDVNETKVFYTETLLLEVVHDWGSMVVFKNRLAIHQFDLLEPRDIISSFVNANAIGSGNLIVYIGTDCIGTEFQRLEEAGVEIVHGIVELPWQKIFRIRENNGYLVEIGEENST